MPVKDAQALADAMIRFVEMSVEGKKRMSRNAYAKAVDEFAVDSVIDIYDGILKEFGV